jgi:hypothetical protein
MTDSNDRQRWLRNSLLGNAAFSILSGLSFAIAAASVSSLLGIEQIELVRSVGIGLLAFASFVAFVATRPVIDLSAALAIVIGDLSWVVGTVPIVMLGVLSPSGVVAALAIADIVLVFAGLQYWGIRRVRGATAAANAAAV